MKDFLVSRTAACLAFATLASVWPMRLAVGENDPSVFDLARSIYATDRQALVAENLQLTDAEGAAFWPLYRRYRAEMEKLGDSLVKLVLEYADAYPNVPEGRARQMLKDYSKLEQKLASQRASYLAKFARIIPPTKALRFAQLENRLDLCLRLQLASKVPLVPTGGR